MHPDSEQTPLGKPYRRKSEQRRRGHMLVVRLDDDEFERIQSAAHMADATAATYLRACGLKRRMARRPLGLPSSLAPADLRKLLAEVNMIGSNLNQLARRSNSGLAVDAAALEAALTDLAAIRTRLRQVLDMPR